MNRRLPGHGTIETLPSGRFRARVPLADGERHNVGTFDSYEDAEGTLVAFVERATQENLAPVGGLTVRALVQQTLDELELAKCAGITNARSIARCWIDKAPFADWPIRRVKRKPIERWVRSLGSAGLGKSYTSQALSLLRKAFAHAVDTDRLDDNPAAKVKIPKGEARTDEPWTFLTPGEQGALLSVQKIPDFWRYAIEISMLTGLRAGELFALRLADLHVGENPRIVVRFGSRLRAPKSRKIREVPLIPRALEAAKEWLALLPEHAPRNPDALAFPGRNGGFIKVSRVPGWESWLRAAGIERRVRWHDLRHTCGASLVSGWWGRAWTLIEVRDLLGHHSVKMTERYAHLGPTALKAAAAGTRGGGNGGGGFGGPRVVQTAPQAPVTTGDGMRPRHSPYVVHNDAESLGNQKAVGFAWAGAEDAAERLVRAAAAGEDCSGLVRELAASVLSSAPVTLAGAALAGGPHALDRALELAALVLDGRAAAFAELRGGSA